MAGPNGDAWEPATGARSEAFPANACKQAIKRGKIKRRSRPHPCRNHPATRFGRK